MIIENLLYLLNCLIFLSGTIFFSYYSLNDFGNKTIIELNCGDMFYLIFIGLINSIICLLTIKNLKLIGFLTTCGMFGYNTYNICKISDDCSLYNNFIWYYYIFTLIVNGHNILLYITLLIYHCCHDISVNQTKCRRTLRRQPINNRFLTDNQNIIDQNNIDQNQYDENISEHSNLINNYE